MGFPRLRCEKAAIQTSNTGLEEAMTWLLAHMDDPGRLFQHLSLITLF
jgi:ubiquitin carboxyl-terminal hydrolase 5/13